MARLELVRRVKRNFQKVYDDEFKAFFYFNIKTGASTWKKPRALEFEEICMSSGDPSKNNATHSDGSTDQLAARFLR